MKYTKISKIAKGWSSYIWKLKERDGKLYAMKTVREKSPRKNLYEREGKFLKLANSVGVGPKLKEINSEENFVVMEFVNGPKFLDWILSTQFPNKKILYNFIKELYKQLLALDSISVSHNQLQVGKNILVKNPKGKASPIIVDFEKATLKTKTKNIGQIESFLFYNPNGAVAKRVREILELNLNKTTESKNANKKTNKNK